MFDRIRESAQERHHIRELREILRDVSLVHVGAWRQASREGDRPAYIASGARGSLWIARSTYIHVTRGSDDETYPGYRIYGDTITVELAANRVVSIACPNDAFALFAAIHESSEQAEHRKLERGQKLAMQERQRSLSELRNRLCKIENWAVIPDGFTALTDKGARVRVVKNDIAAELTIDGELVPFTRDDVAIIHVQAHRWVRAQIEAAERERARLQDPIRDRFLDKL